MYINIQIIYNKVIDGGENQMESELKHSVGKRVRDFRIENGYTQAQFAELIDISVNFLSEIENGKKGMSQDTLCKLCSHFNISADYILFGQTKESEGPLNKSDSIIALANTLELEDLELIINYLSSLQQIKIKKI